MTYSALMSAVISELAAMRQTRSDEAHFLVCNLLQYVADKDELVLWSKDVIIERLCEFEQVQDFLYRD